MVPEFKPKLEASSVCKGNTSTHQNRQDNQLPKESSLQTAKIDRTETGEMDIPGTSCFFDADAVESGSGETTEASSSFGDVESLTDGGLEGDEAHSQLRDDQNPMSGFGGYYDMFRARNKKLTTHWRKFIRPIMWRCKWMELRMRELQLQATRYDKELAYYDERERLGSHRLSIQSSGSQLMKRIKRKRVEDTVDTESYMSQHNFFSYYENNKFVPNGGAVENDVGNLGKSSNFKDELGTSEELYSLESRDEDSPLEDLFRKIEKIQSRIKQLITRVDMVVYENAEKNSSIRLNGGLNKNALGNSAQNPVLLHSSGNELKIEPMRISSRNTSGKDYGNLLGADRPVPSNETINPCEIVNGSEGQFQVGNLYAISEEVLVDHELGEEELNDFEQIENLPPVSVADPRPSKANVKAKTKKRKRKGSRR